MIWFTVGFLKGALGDAVIGFIGEEAFARAATT